MTFHESSTSTLLAVLGQRLRRARLEANLTQQAVADRAGVSLKTVSNAEDGQSVSFATFLLLLQGIGRLGELEYFLADQGPSPIELVKRRGHVRQRATGRRGGSKDGTDRWQW